jgi:hypothetical protein
MSSFVAAAPTSIFVPLLPCSPAALCVVTAAGAAPTLPSVLRHELRIAGELYIVVHAPTSLHSPKQQGDVALKAHVPNICFKCFMCFRGMLQVFFIDVAKVDRDVAYVAMAIYVCFKCMS